MDPFAGRLRVIYVLDTPSTLIPLMHRQLRAQKLSMAAIRETAARNLRRAFPSVTLRPEEGSNGVWTLFEANEYGAARLVLTDLWKRWEAEVGGPMVASAPSRSRVLVANRSSKAADAALRALAQASFEMDDHALSPELFQLGARGWELYRP